MTRATMTVISVVRPKNLYASVPAVPYTPRKGTVAQLEAQLAREDARRAATPAKSSGWW